MAKQNHVVTLRVEIDGIKPTVWRRIAVDSDITLRALHHILQAAFGWTDAHLHEYVVEGLTYGMLDNVHVLEGAEDFDQQIFDERKAKLREIVRAGQQFTYQYDFGDSWMHVITVQSRRLNRDRKRWEVPGSSMANVLAHRKTLGEFTGTKISWRR